MLLGRAAERARLETMLEAARLGLSGALVVRGEAGIGKTALLEDAIDRAQDCDVTRAAGVQSEMELAFAGLHQLCVPHLDRLGRLAAPQRAALGTAFGLSEGEPPDRFLVGLAVLSLLAETAERALVCVVEDAQWLDRASAQTLGFVARRLSAESVVLLFACRDRSEELEQLPEIVLEGLSPADSRQLLASVPGRLDERVRDQIVAETRGNPLALLELPRGFSIAELAGGFGLPGSMPLLGRIEESFRRRIERLPADAQQLLLLAAADPIGDPALVRRAAVGLGCSAGESAAALDGLLEMGERVTFPSPLVRSAVYRAASPEARRTVHQALADATDAGLDPDRRAWHRAHAAAGPDESVAADLERSAGRAQARGGLAAAAAFLARATELTIDPARKADRALAAAHAKHLAGGSDAALTLLAAVRSGPPDALRLARANLLQAQIAFMSGRSSDAPSLLLAAARQLEPLDVRLARETYLDAMSAAMFVGRLTRGGGVLEVASAIRSAPPASQLRPSDLLLDGLALLVTEGYPAGVPIVHQALAAFRAAELSREEGLRWLWLACHTAHDVWDDAAWDVLATLQVELARDAGALTVLPIALTARIGMHVYAGELAAAASLVEELDTVVEATRSKLPRYGALWLAAWRGREDDAHGLLRGELELLAPDGDGMGLTLVRHASAVLCNGLGRYEEALSATHEARDHPDERGVSALVLVELIEAAARSGMLERAGESLDRLSETTRPCATDWGSGVEARSRALLSEGPVAEGLYRESIERLGRTRVRAELARAHLLYGEWLRRERRRIDAREQLRIAHAMLTEMGIEAFAQRAARELVATGESARPRSMESSGQLTAQEAQIARLARDGLSNPAIGTRLFISPRTVEYHLRKAFAKLGINARNQLAQVLPSEEPIAGRV